MIYPHYDLIKGKLVAGSVYSCPNICAQGKERCHRYYEGLSTDGLYTCPYGFSTVVKGEIIVSGIGIVGYCDKQKIKKNGYTSNFLLKQEICEIVNLITEKSNTESSFKVTEGLVLELFHDVRKVNGTAKNNCEELLDSIDESNPIRKGLLNILDASNLISQRLDYYQFVVNPNASMRFEKNSIYRIFEKCIQSLKNTTLPRYITFNLGKCRRGVEGQRIISLVPFIIFDNALKYAPDHSEISVGFTEKNNECTVTVTSLGPKVEATELDLIFKSGYRGIHAVKHSHVTGAGLGLSIVKDICDRHGFSVFAQSAPQPLHSKHSNYCLFSISVVFRNTYPLID